MQWQWQQRSKWALAVTASLAGNADLFCVTRDSAVRYIIYPRRNICVLSKFYLHRDPLKSKGYAAHTDLFPQCLKRPVKRSICRASYPLQWETSIDAHAIYLNNQKNQQSKCPHFNNRTYQSHYSLSHGQAIV